MTNILVIGGAGYIGSHCCKMLKAAGKNPIVLDNLSRGNEKNLRFGTHYIGDLSDKALLKKIFEKENIDAVMHFAAYAYVGESVKHPAMYYENNVIKTIQLLDAMVENDVKNIIFSSTCASYGHPQAEIIDELHPQLPINPYGQSKLMIEKVIKDYHHAYDLNYVIFRYFNAAGCDPDGEVGEDHDPETHLIPLILEAAMDPNRSITVFGTDYDSPDGTCIRDYIHVNDISEAHIRGLDLLKNDQSDIFNLGNGSGFSVKQIIDVAKKVTEKPINVIYGERREGDPAKLVGSNVKANKLLNWKPKFDNIEAIVQTAWNYIVKKGDV